MSLASTQTESVDNDVLLENGDWMTREEFERRYSRLKGIKKAELVEGIVYMPSPVKLAHAEAVALVTVWLGAYAAKHPDLLVASDATVRLDELNETQPDALLMRREGRASVDSDGYIGGAPELLVEVAGSSVSYDLHQKKQAYFRAGVAEYVVWIVSESRLVWFAVEGGTFEELSADANGLVRSKIFEGLVLDSKALAEKKVADLFRLVS